MPGHLLTARRQADGRASVPSTRIAPSRAAVRQAGHPATLMRMSATVWP